MPDNSYILTQVGQMALEYIANPTSFPKACPDPRVDAQAFSDFCKEHLIKQ